MIFVAGFVLSTLCFSDVQGYIYSAYYGHIDIKKYHIKTSGLKQVDGFFTRTGKHCFDLVLPQNLLSQQLIQGIVVNKK